MPELFNVVTPSDNDWWYLDVARLFCLDKNCPNKDICVDGNERVWVDCPTVTAYRTTD